MLTVAPGCRKLIDAGAPSTSLTGESVYTSDGTAASVLTGIYTQISQYDNPYAVDQGLTSLSFGPSLSADELTLYDINNAGFSYYYTNALDPVTHSSAFWNNIYSYVFDANSAIAGLQASSGLTPEIKQQLLGEAEFVRAFSYFYLVGLYGDVPLVLGTDYKVNASLSRAAAADVFRQVIADLLNAKELLSSNYLQSDAYTAYPMGAQQRVRPTKWAAMALLARVYLFTKDYTNALAMADSVIANSSLYGLSPLNAAFLANSQETIWSIQPVGTSTTSNTGAGSVFVLPSTGPDTYGDYPVYMSNSLLNAFEPGDQRRYTWVDSVAANGTTYYYPYKYKIGAVDATTQEYTIVLRLGEQFLIRSEAEAMGAGNGIADAINDLNTVRSRAGLLAYSGGADQSSVMTAILHERQVELFTEWGHRWLDLKRTGTMDAVMGAPGNACAAKGGSWNPAEALYPVPQSEINLDRNLTQNQGY